MEGDFSYSCLRGVPLFFHGCMYWAFCPLGLESHTCRDRLVNHIGELVGLDRQARRALAKCVANSVANSVANLGANLVANFTANLW